MSLTIFEINTKEKQLPSISVKHEATDCGIELQPAKRKSVVLDAVVPILAFFPPTKSKVITKEGKGKEMEKKCKKFVIVARTL